MMPLEQITTQRHMTSLGASSLKRASDISMGTRMATTTDPKNETLRLKRPHTQVRKSTGLEMFLA